MIKIKFRIRILFNLENKQTLNLMCPDCNNQLLAAVTLPAPVSHLRPAVHLRPTLNQPSLRSPVFCIDYSYTQWSDAAPLECNRSLFNWRPTSPTNRDMRGNTARRLGIYVTITGRNNT